MRNNRSHLCTTICSFFVLAAFAAATTDAFALPPPSPGQQLRNATADLNAWLSDSPAAQGWRDYLKLDLLEGELAKGRAADPAHLEEVLKQLKSGAPGLDKSEFQAVAKALPAWIAEVQLGTPDRVVAALKEAKGKFAPLTPDQVEASRVAALKSVEQLKTFLSKDPKRAAAWNEYFGLDALQTELTKTKDVDPRALRDKLKLFTAGYPGMEKPEFTAVRNHVRRYANDLQASYDANFKARFEAALDGVAAAVSAKPTDKLDRVALGQHFDDLATARFDAKLLRAARRLVSESNLFVVANSAVLAAGIENDIDEITPVRDFILGTSIRGTGRTQGRLLLELIPFDSQALLKLVFRATTKSQTTGFNGPAQIHSAGTTQLFGSKVIALSGEGFTGFEPTASATTHTTTTGIGSNRRLLNNMITNIASQRVAESKGTAQRIAASHAEERLKGRLEEQASTSLAKANRGFNDKFLSPLRRWGAEPEAILFATSKDDLTFALDEASATQLAAPLTRPATQENWPLSTRVHESMVNNFCTTSLAGTEMTRERMKQIVLDMTGKLPKEMTEDADQEPWTILFADADPVTVSFDGNKASVVIRIASYLYRDSELPAMNVTAHYNLKLDNGKMTAVRDGDLDISPPGFDRTKGDKLSSKQTVVRRLLSKQFGKIFKPDYKSDGLELPGRWSKLGKLPWGELKTDGTWLVAGWKMPPPGTTPAAKPATTPTDRQAATGGTAMNVVER